MSRWFFAGSLAFLIFCSAPAVSAAEPEYQDSPKPGPQAGVDLGSCAEESVACRHLAVGVAMLNIRERIEAAVEVEQAGRSVRMLCPEDNPQCCPPHLMPLCSRVQRDLALQAQHAYRNAYLPRFERCPFSEEICDGIETFCEADERWLPWAGCIEASGDLPIYCPPGWKQVGPSCQPPPPCECGFEPNSKGICVPKVCQRNGVPVPCRNLCDDRVVFEDFIGVAPAESRLGRHLQDRRIQLEAAERVRSDLQKALKLVEEEIEDLSSQ